VWDLPTRAFHWLLAASFFVALATGDSDRFRDIHVFAGYLILGLLCFRVVWGFAGSPLRPFRVIPVRPPRRDSLRGDLLAARTLRHRTTRWEAARSSRCWLSGCWCA
jgi:cytochrome b